MFTEKRLWRTDKDGELVLDDDPKATALAYGEGDEIAADDEAAAEKALGKGVDKQADTPANKGATKRPARKRS